MPKDRRFSVISTALLASLASSISVDIDAAQVTPVPDNPRQAQTSLGFSIKTRCPELHIADAGTRAVVVFWVPARGEQSQISLKTSSGLADLDSAAVACVAKLKFAPATTLGDGETVDSWQQIALSWADPAKTYEATHPPTATPMTPPVKTLQDKSGGETRSATVHACVDDSGKIFQGPSIVQSSGVPALDQAALKIAAAGSAAYRPHAVSATEAAPGCVTMAIGFGPH